MRQMRIDEIIARYAAAPAGVDADEWYMRAALELADVAAEGGDVPVGCVIVRDGTVIAADCNGREAFRDATYHAETAAIRTACEKLGGWRLTRCTLYVTLEPCPMCAGAIINARIDRVVQGTVDPKAGCCGSVTDLFSMPFNHQPSLEAGVMGEESAALLRQFFSDLRKHRQKSNEE